MRKKRIVLGTGTVETNYAYVFVTDSRGTATKLNDDALHKKWPNGTLVVELTPHPRRKAK